LPQNNFSLDGKWKVTPEYAEAQPGSSLNLNFNAQKVFLVMRTPDESDGTVKVMIGGVQVNQVTVSKDKLYSVIELEEPAQERIELEFFDTPIQVFAFTFG